MWIRDLIEQRMSGAVDSAYADRTLDDVVPAVIRMQEAAGLDYVSDGEWRRDSYVNIFSDAVAGFENRSRSGIPRAVYPTPIAPLRQHRPIALHEARFAKRVAERRIILAVPSPYTVARRLWSPEHSTSLYPTREAFMQACIPIINEELKQLTAAGIDAIQLDDPWLSLMTWLLVDPEYRDREQVIDIEHEIEMSVVGVNGAVDGVGHPFISVHLCHQHSNLEHSTRGPYDLIMGALGRMNVHRFAMEFAKPESGGIEVLGQFPQDKVLGLGVIRHADAAVETAETVVERAEAAMQYVPADRLTLNPDCGFAPSSFSHMDLDVAYLKLQALSDGAELLRSKYA